MSRNFNIVFGVIALHLAVLWAMQTGLLRRIPEAVIPAQILVEIMAPAPAPEVKSTPQQQPKLQPAYQTPRPAMSAPGPTATPQSDPGPLAMAPSPIAPEPSPAAPSVAHAAAAPTSPNPASKPNTPLAPAALPKLELPSSSADYLNNPKPPYPALSKRLGEQGKVLVRVWIGTDGTASHASIKTSSGFDRLDQAALNTVQGWRYVPGKRGGSPEAMWFDVPVNWVLQ